MEKLIKELEPPLVVKDILNMNSTKYRSCITFELLYNEYKKQVYNGKCFESLISQVGTDYGFIDRTGRSIWDSICKPGKINLMKILMQRMNVVKENVWKKYLNASEKKNNSLHIALGTNHVEMAKYLMGIKYGSISDWQCKTHHNKHQYRQQWNKD